MARSLRVVRGFVGALVALVLSIAPATAALANGQLGGGADGVRDERTDNDNQTIGVEAEQEREDDEPGEGGDSESDETDGVQPVSSPAGNAGFSAIEPAARPHPLSVIYEQPCGEWIWFEFDYTTWDIVLWIPPKCVQPLTCGSERIDDHFFGRISGGSELTGVYGAFLTAIVEGTIEGAGGGVADVDVDLTNEAILGSLGEPPSPTSLAAFRWCRHDDGTFERDDPLWGIDFRWDTTIEDEYPIPAILARLQSRPSRY